MQTIDASAILGYNKNYDYSGFVPVHTYTYNAGTKVVVVTDASTLPAGEGFKNSNITIHDHYGNQVTDNITTNTGNSGNISVASLNPDKGLNITANICLKAGLTADGRAVNITTAGGALTMWQKNFNASEAVVPST